MWNLTIEGFNLYRLVSWFFIFSFLGWVWETCYVSIKEKKLVNRGFVTGPFCTIYGFGAVIIYLILHPLGKNIFMLYIGGVIVATTLEYFTAVVMEKVFNTSWWDYSDEEFNYKGRICLKASLGWGIFTIILFKAFMPFVQYLVSLYNQKNGEIALIVVIVIYAFDYATSLITALKLKERIPKLESLTESFQAELLTKIKDKIPNIDKSKLSSLRPNIDLPEKHKKLFKDAYNELQRMRINAASKKSYNFKRFVKAYPKLQSAKHFYESRKNNKNIVNKEER